MLPGTQLSFLDAAETQAVQSDTQICDEAAFSTQQKSAHSSIRTPANPLGNESASGELAPPKFSKAPIDSRPVAKSLKGYDAPPSPEEWYLSVRQVAKRYSVSVPTVWRWVQVKSDFPSPVSLHRGTTRWRMSDLLAYELRSLGA
ncbi:putative DNA-binding transcriptional regulator AlpA [Phyllobacterium trifolii]|jgi:predicted DNA-binding transcriptional regulator AlpA|uniref:Putative DNA-binding transcriptional regulator AlpA n=1 Tax=Phyllobacterium trifolii TaxID=300193 RepID=A0A839U6H1_9HYPH|nr:hypothetical protein [Phyllobacterium trifolii]MBB3144592.1 putative DNA-binding transcriptional regulator AlpA [Phyllobacterium trifolii]